MLRAPNLYVSDFRKVRRCLLPLCLTLLLFALDSSYGAAPAVQLNDDGKLIYAADELGNRIPDFSHCGFDGANSEIPAVPVKVVVQPADGDDGPRIQAAIDYVAGLPFGSDGFRGTVHLAPGEFQVAGQIRIAASGIVLQGSGADEAGTILRATGFDRRALISIRGSDERQLRNQQQITDVCVPVGATSVSLSKTAGFSAGDTVIVTRPSTKEWIDLLDCRELFVGWKPGTRDLRWERTVQRVTDSQIQFDVPITCSIDSKYARGTVHQLSISGRLQNVGVEDLQLESDYAQDNPADEDHAWYGIIANYARDFWLRRIEFQQFAGGAVLLGEGTHSATVEDCIARRPISELGGYRRHTFSTLGQLALFNRCWSEDGRHAFSTGHCAAGPNAFVQCRASGTHNASGPIESWSTGVLYDNVRIYGNDLQLQNRWNSPPHAGWSAANCVLWQCRAANVKCFKPPGENNWSLGCWATHAGDGTIESINDYVKPHSLYQAQLRERVGADAAKRCEPMLGKSIASTSPTYEEAAQFVLQSGQPARELIDEIRDNMRDAARRIRASSNESAISLDSVLKESNESADRANESKTQQTLSIVNGWIVEGSRIKTGRRFTPSWWRGSLVPQEAEAMGMNITRYAPGRFGDGRTNDLRDVADRLATSGTASYEHHYGLWYDRRRDDHLMVRRSDGAVMPPFYEQPFKRSGVGKAWDGLSKYDLSADNPWYWGRLHDLAKLCDQRGMLLVHQHYFQHNILEAGAHWVDCPWRTANNINDTGLPEPPPFIGDKRIFMAEHFYDLSNAKLRTLHRRNIRQCLDAFADCSNVLHLTSAEYTGPVHFVQFWLDTIREWQQETGQDVHVALSCTKDVQDAILTDPKYRELIDVIDIRYWTYDEDLNLYAPPGGKSMAPRQHMRQLKPKASSFASIVKAVSDYRTEYPDKAVLYNADRFCRSGRDGWAVLMGGGSLPDLTFPEELARSIAGMNPTGATTKDSATWRLQSAAGEQLVYRSTSEKSLVLKLPPQQSAYQLRWIDTASGAIVARKELVAAGKVQLTPRSQVVWIVPDEK